jgi:hypothetical protein
MASKYFPADPVWFTPTEKITALNGKDLLPFRDGDPDLVIHVRVESANPASPNAGKVCVIGTKLVVDMTDWTETGGDPVTFESDQWQRFLTQAALDSMRPPHRRAASGSRF